ncbi:uncharacterized protein [Rutidosis leptorrhynchoides]|uniref:uncharacterized protein n=1 Tax=Rutidosis leptorrhynchoides TaxID=125765 RepID=UPI003A991559
MINIASWNIRGLNRVPKQNEVRDVVNSNKLSICAILESHVSIARLNGICYFVFPSWSRLSNNNVCERGTCIIIGWNPNEVRLMILAMTDQVVHCVVKTIDDKWQCFIYFVYADNYYIKRRKLWDSLNYHNVSIGMHPWVILGDFNVSLEIEESTASSSSCTLAMREFRDCIENINMVDVNHCGFKYTWNQRPNSSSGIIKKIDRVMANDVFINGYTNAYVTFQPYRTSDHCPAVLRVPVDMEKKVRSFKFSNYIAKKEGFKATVQRGWNLEVHGYSMYRLVQRLRIMKKDLRKLMWCNGDVHEKVKQSLRVLEEAQRVLDNAPDDRSCRENASDALKVYNQALLDEESFLKQKSKIEWLRVGDRNSAYFHRVAKGRVNRNRIEALLDSNGIMVEGSSVPPMIVQHYEHFLGVATVCEEFHDPGSLFLNKISQQ